MNSTEIRQWQIENFRECMENYEPYISLPNEYKDKLVRRLERGCYNSNIEKSHKNYILNYWENDAFVEQYETICYNLKVNLDPKSSINSALGKNMKEYLASRVYNGIVAEWVRDKLADNKEQPSKLLPNHLILMVLERIPSIPAVKVGGFNSIEMNPMISQKYIEEIALRGNQIIKKKYTTMHPCPNYGHRQATYVAKQTRSGDEGNTHFLTCLVCGDRWKKY